MKKKKLIIITVVALIIILGIIGLGISITHRTNEEQNKIEIKDWKDRYFYYLKNLKELNPIEIGNVGFLDSKISDIPIMYVEQKRTDEEDSNSNLHYYYIKDNEVIFLGSLSYDECPKVMFLYNNDKKEYAYYTVGILDDEEQYVLLESLLQSWAEYENKDDFGQVFYKANENGVIKLDNATEENKDKLFINPNVEETFFKFTEDKNTFRKNLNDYKKQEELTTDEVKKTVEDSIKNIEENSATSEEENTTSTTSIKVGNYTLQYGKYEACFNASVCREIILNQDGSATVDGVSKYFRVDNYNFGQGVAETQSGQNVYPAIILSDTKNGNTGINVYTPYVSTPDCLMTDGELECVNYIGE